MISVWEQRKEWEMNRVCVSAVDQALSSVIAHLILTIWWAVGTAAPVTPRDGK